MSKRINWISPEEEVAEILETVNPITDDEISQSSDFDLRNTFLSLVSSGYGSGHIQPLPNASVVCFWLFFYCFFCRIKNFFHLLMQ
jgi:hypothetical protein